VHASGSANDDAASASDTPGFAGFDAAYSASHSKRCATCRLLARRYATFTGI
jgi:hypothetical protein